MVKIILGSGNPVKVNALKDVLKQYDMFTNAEISGIEVETGVNEQPMSLEETITGSRNRAKNAFDKEKCEYAFGIESGFIKVPGTRNGYIEVTICSIYNGVVFHSGISPGFECPNEIMKFILEDGMDLSQASTAAGYSTDPELGKKQGIVGILTKGKINRTMYTSYAIIMAMVNVDKVK